MIPHSHSRDEWVKLDFIFNLVEKEDLGYAIKHIIITKKGLKLTTNSVFTRINGLQIALKYLK